MEENVKVFICFYLFTYLSVYVCLCLCIYHGVGTHESQKRVYDILDRSYKHLWAFSLGAGNWTGSSGNQPPLIRFRNYCRSLHLSLCYIECLWYFRRNFNSTIRKHIKSRWLLCLLLNISFLIHSQVNMMNSLFRFSFEAYRFLSSLFLTEKAESHEII